MNLPELKAAVSRLSAADLASFSRWFAEYLSHAVPSPSSAVRTGADLVAYWDAEELVGTRPDIVDSSAQARQLREQAQRRGT